MFVLSEETPITRRTSAGREAPDEAVRWRTIAHTDPQRYALVIQADQRFVSPEIEVRPDDEVHLQFAAGLPAISRDGLELRVRFVTAEGAELLVDEHLPAAGDPTAPWRELRLRPGTPGRGRLEIGCGPGPERDPRRDWLAIGECIVGRPDELSLGRARMHGERRRRNEFAHFSKAYRLPMYRAATPTDRPKPNAFTLAQQIIQAACLPHPVNFAQRLRQRAAAGPLRVLSLCAGAARIERGLLDGLGARVELTLMDINDDLLRLAAEDFAASGAAAKVDTICADVNAVELPRSRYDVVICVSALHHVVELEHVVDEIAASLAAGGEFWSIGEYVGRTGARLFDDSYAVADGLFARLPEPYRRNHLLGKGAPDAHLRNFDCSLNTFEGIRSEDILPVLEARMEPRQVDRWSTIAWRVLGPAYVPNYDVEQIVDRALVELIAHRDVDALRSGELRPVGMKGVFVPRR
jgi:SAM-dependent methyltransferase